MDLNHALEYIIKKRHHSLKSQELIMKTKNEYIAANKNSQQNFAAKNLQKRNNGSLRHINAFETTAKDSAKVSLIEEMKVREESVEDMLSMNSNLLFDQQICANMIMLRLKHIDEMNTSLDAINRKILWVKTVLR